METIAPVRCAVEEVQGPYGPISISERVIQIIWLRQQFSQHGLRTQSGKTLTIVDVGTWNFHEGPDFKSARLEIGGCKVRGDVEIHFYPDGWGAHHHDKDPAFNDVVLHVVLFDSKKKVPVRTQSGSEPETLVLLPYLERDLEDIASEQSLLEMEQCDDLEITATYLALDQPARQRSIMQRGRLRWQQKRGFAKRRIACDGWESTCQQMLLEALGLRRNRAPMSRLAGQYPLAQWQQLDAQKLYDQMQGAWKLAGLRPANHPKKRLSQYIDLCTKQPEWPQCWLEYAQKGFPKQPDYLLPTRDYRKAYGLNALHKAIAEDLLVGTIGGTRLETILADCLFPLASAQTGQDYFGHWYHWFLGDFPDGLRQFAREAGIATPPQYPYSNGMLQGILQVFFER